MSPWLFDVYIDGVMKEMNMGMGKRGVSFLEDGKKGSELPAGWERVEIAWPLICR